MLTVISVTLFFLIVLSINLLTFSANNDLWKLTESMRVPGRRYTPIEMRALLEDKKASQRALK